MKIGLVDVDNHNFPNLALMKISAYHKNKGDIVEWANSLEPYDKVYMAKVFSFTKDDLQAYQTKELLQGGTGYDIKSRLSDDIEHCFPDYSLYNIVDTAYGYLSRGCPRGCPFCIVADKEGKQSVKVADLSEFWNGQKNIILLDPNILACAEWKDLLKQLAESRAWVDITQGLDIRLMTDEKAEAINKIKYKCLHFAWDNPNDTYTFDKLKEYAHVWKGGNRNKKVYVLTNYNSTHKEDLDRIYKLVEIGYDPFVMIYDKLNAPQITRDLQRWCNSKFIFYKQPNFSKYNRSLR